MPYRLRAVSAVVLACAACQGSGGAAATGKGDASRAASSAAPPTASAIADTEALLAALAPEYRGTVGHNAVLARLVHGGGRVTGSYFSESSGVTHTLAGLAVGAHVALEDTEGGAKAGALTVDVGKDGVVTGAWVDAHGGGSEPVRLEPLAPSPRPAKALVFKRVSRTSRPSRDGKADACTANLVYPEVYGLAPSAEAKINADLGPSTDLSLGDTCDAPQAVIADYRVAHDGDGLLSVRTTATTTVGDETKHRARTLDVVLATGAPVKLFGDVVKPKAERAFESALSQQIEALARKKSLDADGRKALDQALAFSPPFVLEDKGVRLFADAMPPKYAAAVEEGLLVRYATLPRPAGPAAVMWDK